MSVRDACSVVLVDDLLESESGMSLVELWQWEGWEDGSWQDCVNVLYAGGVFEFEGRGLRVRCVDQGLLLRQFALLGVDQALSGGVS